MSAKCKPGCRCGKHTSKGLLAGRRSCPPGCTCGKHTAAARHAALDLPDCRCIAHFVHEKDVRATKPGDKRRSPSPEKIMALQEARQAWWNSLSDEEKHELQSAAAQLFNKVRWSKPEAKQRQSDASTAARKRRSWHTYSGRQASTGGFRSDIGISVRSIWEANVARYLNYLKQTGQIQQWEYEPRRFLFEDIKRGTRSYLPDFCVTRLSGAKEWWEVKGYWTQKAKTAVKRFRKRFPEETLVILDGPKYKNLEAEFADKLANWER